MYQINIPLPVQKLHMLTLADIISLSGIPGAAYFSQVSSLWFDPRLSLLGCVLKAIIELFIWLNVTSCKQWCNWIRIRHLVPVAKSVAILTEVVFLSFQSCFGKITGEKWQVLTWFTHGLPEFGTKNITFYLFVTNLMRSCWISGWVADHSFIVTLP